MTIFVVDRVREFLAAQGKKLMVLLTYGTATVGQPPGNLPRRDQLLLDHLTSSGVPFVDTLAKHRADQQAFNLSPDASIKRYYNGHYSPAGNHFFAFAIKGELVAWLNPKPPPLYREAASRRLSAVGAAGVGPSGEISVPPGVRAIRRLDVENKTPTRRRTAFRMIRLRELSGLWSPGRLRHWQG